MLHLHNWTYFLLEVDVGWHGPPDRLQQPSGPQPCCVWQRELYFREQKYTTMLALCYWHDGKGGVFKICEGFIHLFESFSQRWRQIYFFLNGLSFSYFLGLFCNFLSLRQEITKEMMKLFGVEVALLSQVG